MTIEEAIEIVESHNKWRCGDGHVTIIESLSLVELENYE